MTTNRDLGVGAADVAQAGQPLPVSLHSDLCVRVARAELERDEAIKRAERAEAAWGASMSMLNDPEKMLDTLHIIGIPARELADIYRVVDEWRAAGGRPEWIAIYTELYELRELAGLA